MTADPVSPPVPSRRRPQRFGPGKLIRIVPLLGTLEQTDDGQWTARTLAGAELSTYPTRAEAGEALVVFAILGGTPCAKR